MVTVCDLELSAVPEILRGHNQIGLNTLTAWMCRWTDGKA